MISPVPAILPSGTKKRQKDTLRNLFVVLHAPQAIHADCKVNNSDLILYKDYLHSATSVVLGPWQ